MRVLFIIILFINSVYANETAHFTLLKSIRTMHEGMHAASYAGLATTYCPVKEINWNSECPAIFDQIKDANHKASWWNSIQSPTVMCGDAFPSVKHVNYANAKSGDGLDLIFQNQLLNDHKLKIPSLSNCSHADSVGEKFFIAAEYSANVNRLLNTNAHILQALDHVDDVLNEVNTVNNCLPPSSGREDDLCIELLDCPRERPFNRLVSESEDFLRNMAEAQKILKALQSVIPGDKSICATTERGRLKRAKDLEEVGNQALLDGLVDAKIERTSPAAYFMQQDIKKLKKEGKSTDEIWQALKDRPSTVQFFQNEKRNFIGQAATRYVLGNQTYLMELEETIKPENYDSYLPMIDGTRSLSRNLSEENLTDLEKHVIKKQMARIEENHAKCVGNGNADGSKASLDQLRKIKKLRSRIMATQKVGQEKFPWLFTKDNQVALGKNASRDDVKSAVKNYYKKQKKNLLASIGDNRFALDCHLNTKAQCDFDKVDKILAKNPPVPNPFILKRDKNNITASGYFELAQCSSGIREDIEKYDSNMSMLVYGAGSALGGIALSAVAASKTLAIAADARSFWGYAAKGTKALATAGLFALEAKEFYDSYLDVEKACFSDDKYEASVKTLGKSLGCSQQNTLMTKATEDMKAKDSCMMSVMWAGIFDILPAGIALKHYGVKKFEDYVFNSKLRRLTDQLENAPNAAARRQLLDEMGIRLNQISDVKKNHREFLIADEIFQQQVGKYFDDADLPLLRISSTDLAYRGLISKRGKQTIGDLDIVTTDIGLEKFYDDLLKNKDKYPNIKIISKPALDKGDSALAAMKMELAIMNPTGSWTEVEIFGQLPGKGIISDIDNFKKFTTTYRPHTGATPRQLLSRDKAAAVYRKIEAWEREQLRLARLPNADPDLVAKIPTLERNIKKRQDSIALIAKADTKPGFLDSVSEFFNRPKRYDLEEEFRELEKIRFSRPEEYLRRLEVLNERLIRREKMAALVDQDAIKFYTNDDYYTLNKQLRDGKVDKKHADIATRLNRTLENPLLETYQGPAFRGLVLSMEEIDEYRQLIFNRRKGLDDTIVFKGFTSSNRGISKNPEMVNGKPKINMHIADTFITRHYAKNPGSSKVAVMMEIRSRSGKDIGNVAENEILFRANSKFRIVEVDMRDAALKTKTMPNGFVRIVLEEIPGPNRFDDIYQPLLD